MLCEATEAKSIRKKEGLDQIESSRIEAGAIMLKTRELIAVIGLLEKSRI